jgi:hypothetical protein
LLSGVTKLFDLAWLALTVAMFAVGFAYLAACDHI